MSNIVRGACFHQNLFRNAAMPQMHGVYPKAMQNVWMG